MIDLENTLTIIGSATLLYLTGWLAVIIYEYYKYWKEGQKEDE